MASKEELQEIEELLKRITRLSDDLDNDDPYKGKSVQEIAKFFGGASKAVDKLKTEVAGLRSQFVDLSSGLEDITKSLNQSLEKLGVKGPTIAQNITKSVKGLKSVASSLQDIQDDLGGATEKQIKRLIKRNQLENLRLERQKQAAKDAAIEILQQKRSTFSLSTIQQDLAKLTAEELEYRYGITGEEINAVKLAQEKLKFEGDLGEALRENLRRVKNINKAQGLTGKLIKGIGGSLEKIGFGDLDLSDIHEDMIQLAADLTENGDKAATLGDRFKVMKKGLKGIGESLASNLKDPLVIIGLIGKGIKSLVELGQKVNKEVAIIGQSLGNFGSRTSEVAQNLREMAVGNVFLSIEEAREALIALNKEFGTSVEFSERESIAFKEISKDLGVGAENTAKLYRLSQVSGTSFENIASEVRGVVDSLNQANGLSINQTEIMEMVANASAQVRANLGNNPKALAEAAFHARKLGYSLDEIKSSAESTLDFESSIEKQLTAQLLLGKDIDLTNYRRAALSGNAADQAKELNKLIAENADDLDGNVIKQQEFANMLGISAEKVMEGVENLKIQEELAKKGIKDRVAGEKAIQAIMKKTGKTRQEAFAAYSKQEIEAVIASNQSAETIERTLQEVKEIVVEAFAPTAESLVMALKSFVKSSAFQSMASLIKNIGEFINQHPMAALTIAFGTAIGAALGTFKLFLAARDRFPKPVVVVNQVPGGGLGTTAASTAAMGAGGAGGGAAASGAKPSLLKRAGSFMKGKRGRVGLIMGGIALAGYGASKLLGGSDEQPQETTSSPSSSLDDSNTVIKLLKRITRAVEKLSAGMGGSLSNASYTPSSASFSSIGNNTPPQGPESEGGNPSMAGAGSLALGGGLLGGAALMGRQAGSAASSAASSTTTAASRTAAQVGKTLTGAAAQSSAQAGNATVTRAIMKDGTKLYGAAAKSAVQSGSATATRATMNATAQAGAQVGAQAGGGFFSNAVKGVKSFGKALKTPGKSFAKFLKTNSKAILKNFAKWGPISALIEGIFLYPEIQDILANPDITKKEKDFEIGKKTIKSITAVGGGTLAAALAQAANIIPGLGLLLGSFAYMGGDWIGRKLGGFLADLGPETTSNFGSFISKNIFPTGNKEAEAMDYTPTDSETFENLAAHRANLPTGAGSPMLNDFISRPGEPLRTFNRGDIVIGGTNLLDNTNRTSTTDTSKVERLLERLTDLVAQGGDVYLDSQKVGTALGMASYKS